jgi:NTP pyrophosphatase (non-canonical NTP hydrolase)
MLSKKSSVSSEKRRQKKMSERDDLTEQMFHEPVPHPMLRKKPVYREAEAAADKVFPELVLAPENEQRADDFVQGYIAGAEPTAEVEYAQEGFDFLLGKQIGVEEVWGRRVDTDNDEAVSEYIRDVVLCATDELHEVLGEVNWKPWKDKRGIKDHDKYREEMADVLHFILDLYLAAGLTGKDIVNDYLSKNAENLRRNTNPEYRAS